jgi:tetratricopeptide (TPR) repeat protein
MPWVWLAAALQVAGSPAPGFELPPLSAGDYPAALGERLAAALERARKEPQDAGRAGALGMLLHAHEQLEPALACYRRARHLDPGAFEWPYLEGVILARLAQHAGSAEALRAAVRLDPGSWPARLKLAQALLAAGDLAAAELLFRELLAERPRAPQPHFGLGRVEAARDRLEAAAERYLEATRLFEAYGAAHYALALAYRDLERPEDARRHLGLYQEHLLDTPPLEDAVMERVRQLVEGPRQRLAEGVRLGEAGDVEGAIREHERALALDPQLHQAHVNLISLYGGLGRWSDAERHYRAAVELAPGRGEPHYDYGVALARQGRLPEAVIAFQKALDVNPYHPGAHNNLGSLLLPEGRLDEAAGHFRAALENDPGHRAARFNLARVLGAQGRLGEAIEELHKIVTPEDEETPRYLFALGAAYVRAGEREKGAAYAREALQMARELGQAELAAIIERDLRRLEPSAERR